MNTDKGGHTYDQYREIFLLKSLGFSERNMVTKVTKRADELQLKGLLDFDMTDNVLQEFNWCWITGGSLVMTKQSEAAKTYLYGMPLIGSKE